MNIRQLYITILVPIMLIGFAQVGASELADSSWPKFRHDVQNTGRSPHPSVLQPGLKWSYTTGGYVGSSPAIASDGTIYIGSNDNNLYAFYENGTLKWSYSTGSWITSSPAIASDETIYIGSGLGDGNLYAINPEGTLKWSYPTGIVINPLISSSPAIASDGTIYIGSYDGNLYALHENGTLKWSSAIVGTHIDSSPAIASDGTIYIGSYDGNLYALHENGTLKWSYATENWIWSSPAIASDGTIYVGSRDNKLYAINPDGTLKWSYTTGGWVDSSPAIASDGTIYVGSAIGADDPTYSGSDNFKLYAINPDGTLKWSYTIGSVIHSSPSIASDGAIYIGSNDYNLYAFNENGTLRWSFRTGGPIKCSPAIASDGTIYVGSANSGTNIYAIGEALPTTLTISPSSFTMGANESISLTATLVCDGSALENKFISWRATAGRIGSTSTFSTTPPSWPGGVTDSNGQITVTYRAPNYATMVTVTASFSGEVTASFSGENLYAASQSSATGTILYEFSPAWIVVVIVIVLMAISIAILRKRKFSFPLLKT